VEALAVVVEDMVAEDAPVAEVIKEEAVATANVNLIIMAAVKKTSACRRRVPS
jgi:hypothetical protein